MQRFVEAQTILVCYPKCGSTWLSAMLTHYLKQKFTIDHESYRNVYSVSRQVDEIDTVWRTHDDDPQLKLLTEFYEDKSHYKGKKVLFLVRDPRDVVISYYFWYTRRRIYEQLGYPAFHGDASHFLFHPIGGIPSVVHFYNIWAGQRVVPAEFILVRYEELTEDARGQLKRVLRFIGEGSPDMAIVDDAVESSRFSVMRDLERRGVSGLKLSDETMLADENAYKTRRGVVAGYKDYIEQKDLKLVDGFIHSHLDEYYGFYK